MGKNVIAEFVERLRNRGVVPGRLTLEEYAERQLQAGFGPDGRFVPDPVPMEPPIGYVKQPSMVEIVRDMVRSEKLRAEIEAAGHESFEEADDFDVGDDPELLRSGYEDELDEGAIEEVVAHARALQEEKAAEPPAGSDGGPGAEPPADDAE